MIQCHRKHLESRCRERGYTMAEVMPCVVQIDGDAWTVDPQHPAYPATPKPKELRGATATVGPGTELKKLLAAWPWKIKASPTCPCNRMARQMDEWGCDECEKPERIAEILSFMEPEARKRKLVWSETAARAAIWLAIRRARRAERKASK